MERALTTLRFLEGLLVPGGVLLLATRAVQREEVVRSAAAPYATYYCVGAMMGAVLLNLYYDQAGLLGSAAAVFVTVLALGRWITDSSAVKVALVILFPLSMTVMAIVAAQPIVLMWIAGMNSGDWDGLAWMGRLGETRLPPLAQLSFAIGAITLVTLVFSRRTKVEQGLFWALGAMYLGVSHLAPEGAAWEALFFYAGTAGVILLFAVLEHGYDIAFRDELTGLPGRRAFNNVIEQLGGTYAIAMCDVDHFKRFNDTYGHDVGDQVLKMVATKLSQVGGGGKAFRYGGEEFLVVFRGRSAREAEPFAESLRRSIVDKHFVVRSPERPTPKPWRKWEQREDNARQVNITISIGIAERSTRHSTPDLVLDAADDTLYQAKASGRNCVKLDESTASAPAVQR